MMPWRMLSWSWKPLVVVLVVALSPAWLGGASRVARLARRPAEQARLFSAIDAEDVAAIRRALADGADINGGDAFGDSPVTRAAMKADLAVLMAVLASGANPDGASARYPTPLLMALVVGRTANAAALLDAGADPNRTHLGIAPLIVAANLSDDTMVRALLAAGADANGVPACDRRPLIEAIENPEAPGSMMHLLLLAGADPDAPDGQGRTARAVAAQLGRTDALALPGRQASP